MTCPMCQKESVHDYRPFCSKRCADLDLAKWFDGTYTMASDEEAPLDIDDTDPPLN